MKLIQVRNVPDEVHQRLKIRAAERGVTLSQLVYDAVVDYAERPSMADFRARVDIRDVVELDGGGAAAVATARGARPQ